MTREQHLGAPRRVGVGDLVDVRPAIGDRRAVRLSLVTAPMLLASACLALNPAFDGADAGTGSTSEVDPGTNSTTTSSGTDPTTTAAPSTEALTSGEATAGETTADVVETSSMSSGTPMSGTTSGGSSGAPMAMELSVAASIGTCVFPAAPGVPFHGGPAECSGDADQINNTALTGLMMVDVQVNDVIGKMRPAVPVLRFDVPAGGLDGLTLVSATLHVQVSDGVTFLPQSGELWRVSPFTVESLNIEAPAPLQLLAADKGEVQPDELLTWELAPASIKPGQPLFFALKPTHDKGVLLRGASTNPGAPYLSLVFE